MRERRGDSRGMSRYTQIDWLLPVLVSLYFLWVMAQ